MSYAQMDRDFRTPYRADPEEPVFPLVQARGAAPVVDQEPWSAHERSTFDDAYWESLLEEEQLDADWKRRRPRRVVVRILGWAALAGIIWGAVLLTGFGPARRAIVEWGTLGSDQAAGMVR